MPVGAGSIFSKSCGGKTVFKGEVLMVRVSMAVKHQLRTVLPRAKQARSKQGLAKPKVLMKTKAIEAHQYLQR